MTRGFREYDVHPEAIRQAQRVGLSGNVEQEVARMARYSAPFTHPAGNRRYYEFVMRIENEAVVSIAKLDDGVEAKRVRRKA